jgi:GWxTD domain-containing protein
MIKISIILIVLALAFTCGAPTLSAQTGYRSANEFGEARFAIEAADFRSDKDELHTLEIYYKIFYDALSYQKTETGYEASYEIAIVVEGKSGEQIEGIIREGEIKVKTFAETRRSRDFVINLVTINLNEQDIVIKAILTDKLSQSSREVEEELKKREYWNKYPSLSRVEFGREVSPVSKESKFNKYDVRVIPSVTRLFGGDFDTVLTYYQEAYPGRNKVKYAKLITKIYSRIKGLVYSDTISYGEVNETKREVHNINVSSLRPGDYELEIRLEGRRGKLYDKLIEEFELELTAETIFQNDYKTAIEMMKYLATREELKRLKNSKTDEERRHHWDEFWKLRGNDRRDQENPPKEEYFRRIRHANRYFSYMKREGWRTTRGMIYVTYGEPDEVEDYPFELATKPYQVWLYYRLNPPRKFLFIDEWGDGNLELQPPFNGLDW